MTKLCVLVRARNVKHKYFYLNTNEKIAFNGARNKQNEEMRSSSQMKDDERQGSRRQMTLLLNDP